MLTSILSVEGAEILKATITTAALINQTCNVDGADCTVHRQTRALRIGPQEGSSMYIRSTQPRALSNEIELLAKMGLPSAQQSLANCNADSFFMTQKFNEGVCYV